MRIEETQSVYSREDKVSIKERKEQRGLQNTLQQKRLRKTRTITTVDRPRTTRMKKLVDVYKRKQALKKQTTWPGRKTIIVAKKTKNVTMNKVT